MGLNFRSVMTIIGLIAWTYGAFGAATSPPYSSNFQHALRKVGGFNLEVFQEILLKRSLSRTGLWDAVVRRGRPLIGLELSSLPFSSDRVGMAECMARSNELKPSWYLKKRICETCVMLWVLAMLVMPAILGWCSWCFWYLDVILVNCSSCRSPAVFLSTSCDSERLLLKRLYAGERKR